MASDNFPDFDREGEYLDPARKTLSIETLLLFKTFEEKERLIENKDGQSCRRIVYEIDLDGEIKVTFDPIAQTYMVESMVYLSTPIRVPAELVTITGHEESSDVSNFGRLHDLPVFGVTMLGTSHGFDPRGQTTGFVVWANCSGTMVDPPSNAMACLEQLGISSRVIDSIVLTHCHSDHDAGTFRKLLFDHNTKVYTTPTILNSFIRKYSAITNMTEEFLRSMLHLVPVQIGAPTMLHGAEWMFRYSLHTIPCIGFTVKLQGKSFSYSADTHYSVSLAERMFQKGVIGFGRRNSLIEFPFDSDLILHEAGVPPIHTPISELLRLSDEIKSRLRVVHIAQKDIPKKGGLQGLSTGETMTIAVPRNSLQIAMAILDLFCTMEMFEEGLQAFGDASKLMYLIKIDEYHAGNKICQKGDRGGACFVLLRGIAEVVDGTFRKHFHVGDYFGETSLVTGKPRNADVFARDNGSGAPISVAVISQECFNEITKGTQIQHRLVRMAMIRQFSSWQLMNKNTVLRRFSTGCKTQLESIMLLRVFKKGQKIWHVDEKAQFAFLIRTGRFAVDISVERVQRRKMSFDQENKASVTKSYKLTIGRLKPPSLPLEKGCAQQHKLSNIVSEGGFVGDFDALLCNQNNASDVSCISQTGTCLLIHRTQWMKFLQMFPGPVLILNGKQFVV